MAILKSPHNKCECAVCVEVRRLDLKLAKTLARRHRKELESRFPTGCDCLVWPCRHSKVGERDLKQKG